MGEYQEKAASFLERCEMEPRLGAGKAGDGKLDKNKFSGATVVWAEGLDSYLLVHLCQALIIGYIITFFWNKVSIFLRRRPERRLWILISKLIEDAASGLLVETTRLFPLVFMHDDASARDLKKFLLIVVGLSFLSVASGWAHFFRSLFYNVLQAVGRITKAMISFPAFNESLNDFCAFLLDEAISLMGLDALQRALLRHAVKKLILNVLKMLGKKALVLMLVGSGESSEYAKEFVDLYVQNTV